MTHPAPIQHLPPVTQDHLQRAFVVLAYRDTTFEQAMADPVRRQVLHTCASHLRTQDYEHTTKRTVEPTRQHPRQHSLDLRDAQDLRGGMRSTAQATGTNDATGHIVNALTTTDANGVSTFKDVK